MKYFDDKTGEHYEISDDLSKDGSDLLEKLNALRAKTIERRLRESLKWSKMVGFYPKVIVETPWMRLSRWIEYVWEMLNEPIHIHFGDCDRYGDDW